MSESDDHIIDVALDALEEGDQDKWLLTIAQTDLYAAMLDDIQQDMARTLWVMAFADWAEEHPDEPGAERPGPGGDWGNVAPVTPDAARAAMADLEKLYLTANEVGDLGVLFAEAVRADFAAESGDLKRLAGSYHGILSVARDMPRPLTARNYGELLTRSIIDDPSVAQEFGSDLAMMGLGTGVSWFDDHTLIDIEGPHHFECHFEGGHLWWSGMANSALGDVPGFAVARLREFGDRRLIRISYETFTPEAEDDDEIGEERGWENEEGVEIDPDAADDHGGDTDYVTPAVRFLRDEGVTESSSSNWQEPPVDIWYTAYGDPDVYTGARTNRSFHLDGFTPDELHAIYDEVG